jgi:diguanylate cyclase (GGDEF)-like protein
VERSPPSTLLLRYCRFGLLKQINHRYGHALGDRVLSRLGELLRQTFHNQDVVDRWGGTEFVVGMAGMTKTEGVQRLWEVLKSLRQIELLSLTKPSSLWDYSNRMALF